MRPTAPHSSVRRDIQGLRAVAVLAVILEHAVGRPVGGFLGVDVFFVISGFIITSLLLREFDRSGRISFIAFYRRRVKRILPASLLVLVATTAAGWLLIGGERARAIVVDAIAATFFVGNWRFAAEGADYWADTAVVSPLQHYWSLGVEEQFYLVWPALLAGCTALAVARTQPVRRILAVALVLIASASLIWGALQTGADPSVAYFSTLTRAWELAIGALIAVAAPLLERSTGGWRQPAAWTGVMALIVTIATSHGDGMPVPGALVAVLATAMIIAAGTGRGAPEIWPLANRASGYIGNLSFSLYLWHFPVIVFVAPYAEGQERRLLVIVLVAAFALAAATYHLVENPVRRSQWLERGSGRPARVATVAGAVVLASAVVAGVAVQAAPVATSARAETAPPSTDADVRGLLDEALAAREWPMLIPALADIGTLGMPAEDAAGCAAVDLADDESCFFPSPGATRTAVVMGDSTGIVLLPMIRAALGDGWDVKGLTMAACYQVDVERWYDDAEHEASCEAHQAGALEEVQRIAPDLVFVSDLYTGVWHLEPGADALDGGGSYLWAIETAALAERLRSVADDVVFVQSPPRRDSPAACAVAGSRPSDCVHEVDVLYREVSEGERAAVTAAGATYLTVEEWFCVDGRCPAFAGTTPTMRDEMHVTSQYAELLAPLLRSRLDAVGAAQ